MALEPVDRAVWSSKLRHFRKSYERHRLLGRLSLGSPEAKEEELALLKAFFAFTRPIEGRVLDIGCGDGFYRTMIPGADYLGVDPLAWGEHPAFPFVAAMGEALPFCSGSFDHALVVTSLDHAQDPARFLAEGRRILKAGGSLHLLCGLEGEEVGEQTGVRWGRLRSEGIKALVRGTITRFYRFAFGIQDTHPYEFTGEEIRGLLARSFPKYESQAYSRNIVFFKARVP
jgi:SAM-dependent methyltransferase